MMNLNLIIHGEFLKVMLGCFKIISNDCFIKRCCQCTCSCPAMTPKGKENHGRNEGLKIFEYYEIHPSVPRLRSEYGSWTAKDGLRLIEPSKWIRRKDMQVSFYHKSISVALQFKSKRNKINYSL